MRLAHKLVIIGGLVGVLGFFLPLFDVGYMGAEVKIQEVTGLISFVFDLVIPVPSVLWTETYERPASYRGYATPYKYGLRQQFPISQGS